jgi:hypothetical protein
MNLKMQQKRAKAMQRVYFTQLANRRKTRRFNFENGERYSTVKKIYIGPFPNQGTRHRLPEEVRVGVYVDGYPRVVPTRRKVRLRHQQGRADGQADPGCEKAGIRTETCPAHLRKAR